MIHGVDVLTDSDPIRCTGTDVSTWTDSPSGDPPPNREFAIEVAEMRPGMDCRLRFFIRNTTSHDVDLEQIVIPIFGSQGGPGVEVTSLNRIDDLRGFSAPAGGLDAEFDFDRKISPDSEHYFEAVNPAIVSWMGSSFATTDALRPTAMTALRAGMWPIVTVRFRQMDHELDSAAASFGFTGTEFSDCDSASALERSAATGTCASTTPRRRT